MLFAASSSAAEPLDPFTQNERIGRSVNIIGYDPIWKSVDQARFKARHFQLIKQAGFNSVRINLAPFRAMDANNDNQLSDAWLKVLDWAVRGALDNNLAVILDCHEHNALGNDPEGNHERFLAFWRQIAPRFRDASSNVIFELLNEPTRKLSPELWNTYLAESLALVRQSNPTRTVIIGPGNGNGFNALDRLKLPENDRNIIVTIHYYFPMAFTHQGAPFSAANRDKTGVEWLGTPREQQDIVQNFGQSQAWAKANNRPIFLGEFGAYDKAPMESRARYTAFVCRTAEKLGWSWAYWQLDSDFILYNIEEDRWVEPIRNALIPR
ncbi:MAG: glycoside hydrolase family 5 protein [Acidobacteriia bacterium]|nr:glycoside hydrolase family 5 protein [Terriglobia bacterium]